MGVLPFFYKNKKIGSRAIQESAFASVPTNEDCLSAPAPKVAVLTITYAKKYFPLDFHTNYRSYKIEWYKIFYVAF